MSIGYTASPWGNEFHSLTQDVALGGGSAGPGKTTALIMDVSAQVKREHERCMLPKDHAAYHEWGSSVGHALYLRRLDKQLLQTKGRMLALYKALDPTVVFRSSENLFVFRSGMKVQVGHCQNRDDWNLYVGNEYTKLLFDEANQFLKTQVDWIATRLRTSDQYLRPLVNMRMMSNPVLALQGEESFVVDDPFWLRKEYVDPAPDGREVLVRTIQRPDGRKERITSLFLPAKLSDNPDKAFVDDYELQLLDRPKHIRQALLDGNWYVVAGAFHSEEWDEKIHVVPPFVIPKDWHRFRSMDWGFKTHGCIGWWAVDREQNMVLERSVMFKEKHPNEVAREIIMPIEIELGLWNKRKNQSTIIGPSDKQIWEERGGNGLTKYEEFLQSGVAWVPADQTRRKRNAQHLSKRLRDNHQGTVTPGFRIFSGKHCQDVRVIIPAVPTDPKDRECPADFADDHPYDMVLYGCGHASRGLAPRRGGEDGRLDGRRLKRYAYDANSGYSW